MLLRGDVDYFQVNLEAEQNYVFHLRGEATGEGTLSDPFLEIRSGSDGAVVEAFNDNGGWGENSLISFTPTAPGEYFVVVKADQPADGKEVGTGSYTLLTRKPDDYGDNSLGAYQLEVGQTLAGGIQYNDGVFGAAALDSFGSATNRDIDWFSVSLKAGETYSVEVDAAEVGLSPTFR